MTAPAVALTAFVICSVANLFATWADSRRAVVLTKPLIVPTLAAYYLLVARASPNGVELNWLVFAGLIAGFLGDVFLLSERGFLFGLASFLIGHLLYLTAFVRSLASHSPNLWLLLGLLPLGLYGACYLRRLGDRLGEMRAPVTVYVAVIVAMSIAALMRAGVLGNTGGWLAFGGSLFFIASDSLLGAATFRGPDRSPRADRTAGHQTPGRPAQGRSRWTSGLARPLVMPTYLIAQFLIVQGLLM